MDSRQMSYDSNRDLSRVYQDLATYQSLDQPYSNVCLQSDIMDYAKKLRNPELGIKASICIVGAGIAGLRCADVLLHNGFQVTIVEARERIGGRVHQALLPGGYTVDMGPNWIHGTENNPILDLAKKTDTSLHSWGERVDMFGEDGSILRDGASLSDIMWGIIVKAFQYSAENTSTIDPETSLYEYVVGNVEEVIPPGVDHEYQRKTILHMAQMWGGFVGSPVTQQSLKFFWLEECVNGENLFCSGTFQNMLDHIAEPALEHAQLILSTPVTSINTTDDKVEVILDKHATLRFDEVIVTCPLGFLQKNKSMFSPPLPPRFSQAIDGVGYGCLEKVYITFPRAFWLDESTDPRKQPFSGFTQWLSPSFAVKTNPDRWYQESIDMSTLPGEDAHPTLLFYIFGDQSITLSRALTALKSKEEKQEHLVTAFKPYFSCLPHYVEGGVHCTPLSCLATNWVADEFAGFGSYSTFHTGLKQCDKDIEIMREGLPGRGIWFAGEHTGPFISLGTATSAYWSGEHVAQRLASAYDLTTSNGHAE